MLLEFRADLPENVTEIMDEDKKYFVTCRMIAG